MGYNLGIGELNLKEIIKTSKVFEGKSNLASLATSIFDFTQFLLDDDENLTKTGNLNAKAKTKLHERINELFSTKVDDNAVTGGDED